MFQIFCTGEDVAFVLGVSYDTLERRVKEETGETLSDFIKKHQSFGRISLRQKQYKVALDGDVTMLIWLGKQHLSQKQNPDGVIPGEKLSIEVIYEDD